MGRRRLEIKRRDQPQEWRLWRKGVKVVLWWRHTNGQTGEPCQQLSFLEGCHPHIPRGLIHGVCGTAKEMSHRVVGGPAIRAGGAIDPSYRVAVGGVAAAGSIGRGGHKNLVGCLRPDDLLSSGGLLGGVWLWNKRPLQSGHHDRRLVQVWWWIAVYLTKDF